ncbi:MAG: DUF362 domain-containing protein [Gemmatimonadales bacterium]|nr:DUF362 domain-containing protein [Gemmatimonadales bacterium]NIN12382.1 DUF362 domain-containing protein [Gemmatimonadales bacterium]NIN48920.1 DUF362 domain-containing protein [Gemmatimonadales bacterium]NIP06384.1 DUF362 domain-containing protein [Gemmatimonadales bacterium]NIR00757.1 DUF362 domain-containing protein [Gemmatimonadales bacterium]
MRNELIIKRVRSANLKDDVAFLFGLLRVPERMAQLDPVLLKPNIFSRESAEAGATTDMQLLGTVIDYFTRQGKQVMVVEAGANQYAQSHMFADLGLYEFCAERKAEFVNLNESPSEPVEFEIRGRKLTFQVPTLLLRPHFLVNLPKFKTHLSTRVSWAMKNLYGLLPDKVKWMGHRVGIHETLLALNQRFPAHAVLMDGIVAMKGMGPTMGLPVQKNLLFAAPDQFVHDLGLLRLLNIRHVPHIERCTGGRPMEIAYQFLNEAGDPVEPAELGVDLRLPPLAFSRFFIRTNQLFFTLAPFMEKFFNPKSILNFMVNRPLVGLVRNVQKLFRV